MTILVTTEKEKLVKSFIILNKSKNLEKKRNNNNKWQYIGYNYSNEKRVIIIIIKILKIQSK